MEQSLGVRVPSSALTKDSQAIRRVEKSTEIPNQCPNSASKFLAFVVFVVDRPFLQLQPHSFVPGGRRAAN